MKIDVMTYMLLSKKFTDAYFLEMYLTCVDGEPKFEYEFSSARHGYDLKIKPEDMTSHSMRNIYEKMVKKVEPYKSKLEESIDELKLFFKYPVSESIDAIDGSFSIVDAKEYDRIGLRYYYSVVTVLDVKSLKEKIHNGIVTDSNIKETVKSNASERGKIIPKELFSFCKSKDKNEFWLKWKNEKIARVDSIRDINSRCVTIRKVDILYYPLEKIANTEKYKFNDVNTTKYMDLKSMLLVIQKKNLKRKNVEKLLKRFKRKLVKDNVIEDKNAFMLEKCYEDDSIIMYKMY